jgi:hypothetical protein
MKHDRGLCGCVPKASLPEDYGQTFSFCVLAMLCASVASCQPPTLIQNCFLPIQKNFLEKVHLQASWLKMPKRDRCTDTGMWAVSDSPSGDDAAMVTHPLPAPPAGATQPEVAAARCPYSTCTLCAWKVPPAQHKDYVFIYGIYKTLLKTLEEEPELTPAEKCEQSQLLNWQLMSMERQLFDNGDIKENDPLMPLTYLRSSASAAGAWGMISLPAPPPGCPANSRSAGSGAAGSAAAAGADDANGDDPSDGAKGKKPRKRKQPKPTLELFQNYTEEDWEVWYRGAEPRLEWSPDYTYEIWVDTAEGKKKVPGPCDLGVVERVLARRSLR